MTESTASASELDAVEREIVDHLFVLQPAYAVGLGLHQYDGVVPDLGREATDRWTAQARSLLGRLGGVDAAKLASDRRIDAFLLRLVLEGPLFDIHESRELERNPMTYLSGFSLTPYLAREYASPESRFTAVVRVLEGVPRYLEVGRNRLDRVLPKPFIDLALSIGGGLPAHFAEAGPLADATGRAPELARARADAEAAVREFLEWLRAERLPRATPEFALGAARFQKLLYVREGVEAPFEEIRRAGLADLGRNQARLAELARASQLSIPEFLARMNADHPPAAEVLATARRFVEETRAFVVDQRLVSVPPDVDCRVEETPAWGRALSTASMNPPGPFDPGPPLGIYYVTPTDPAWTPVQQEEWLRSFNYAMLRNVTVHEVYPGHYLQFLHFRSDSGSLARKVYLSPSFVEGWAHYTEQLAIEHGLGRENGFAEGAQVHDALLRDCRLLAAIGLHTAGMTLEAATQLFQTEAHFERLPAEREAIRGTFNPEYFCYTLGKLSILDARGRFLAKRFGGNLASFHDALLGFGCPPIGLLETLLSA